MPDDIGPLQVDEITSAGSEHDIFEPRMSTKGFRYVRVEGHPKILSRDDVRGVVVHSDLRRTGWFECSNERVNRLHEAAVQTLKANMVDIPTDCPHRERSGWTSEWQIFVRSAAFLYDVAGFTTKWLRDLAADQKRDGAVFHTAPENKLGKSEAVIPAGSAGYSDAAVIVPWRIYRAYGDERLLAEQWSSMAAWVDRCEHLARTKRHPDRAKSRPTPAPHEQFLRDTGVHFGEWVAPPSPVDQWNPKLAKGRDDGDFATAYFHYSAKLLGRIARVLGDAGAAQRYENLAENIRSAWWTEYGNADGSIRRPTKQITFARSRLDWRPTNAREGRPAIGRLDPCRRHACRHRHFRTAFLLPVLADAGHADVAYELLLQDTPPSWMTMIDRGLRQSGKCGWRRREWQGPFLAESLQPWQRDLLHAHPYCRDPPRPGFTGVSSLSVAPVPGGDLTWDGLVSSLPMGRSNPNGASPVMSDSSFK